MSKKTERNKKMKTRAYGVVQTTDGEIDLDGELMAGRINSLRIASIYGIGEEDEVGANILVIDGNGTTELTSLAEVLHWVASL
jgi:hypothetical protein